MKERDLLLLGALVLLAWLVMKQCRCEQVTSTINYDLPETS
jgi:hypothetical protein